jgi:hypothetical protein
MRLMRRCKGALCASILVLALVLLTSGRMPTTHAALDLTGDWTFTIVGDYTANCSATFVQAGQQVSGPFNCPNNDGTLDMTVTPQDGMYLLEGPVTFPPGQALPGVWDVVAQVYPSGNNLTGTWEASGDNSGTLSGTRDVPSYTKGDLNCDSEVDGRDVLAGARWSLDLDPLQGVDCPVIGADLGVIFGDIDCSGAPDFPDALPLLRYVAGVPPGLPQDCLPIGQRYSPVLTTQP